jgi:transposase, IS5 family
VRLRFTCFKSAHYQNHGSIDPRFGFIRRWATTDAGLRQGLHGFVSHINRKKPKGRVMLETVRRANNAKSKIRSRVEHVFAEQKDRMGLFIGTLGIARATAKIEMANRLQHQMRCFA